LDGTIASGEWRELDLARLEFGKRRIVLLMFAAICLLTISCENIPKMINIGKSTSHANTKMAWQGRSWTRGLHSVVGQLPQHENNAMLCLLSASAEIWRYGADHYQQNTPDTSSLILDLLKGFRCEGITMPYTMEEYRRDYANEHFKDLTAAEQEEAIKKLSPEQRKHLLERLMTEQAVKQPKKRRRK